MFVGVRVFFACNVSSLKSIDWWSFVCKKISKLAVSSFVYRAPLPLPPFCIIYWSDFLISVFVFGVRILDSFECTEDSVKQTTEGIAPSAFCHIFPHNFRVVLGHRRPHDSPPPFPRHPWGDPSLISIRANNSFGRLCPRPPQQRPRPPPSPTLTSHPHSSPRRLLRRPLRPRRPLSPPLTLTPRSPTQRLVGGGNDFAGCCWCFNSV